jgi:predicted alpha-1,2-mannosidase
MKVSKAPKNIGYWKKQREMKGVEAEWDPDSGKYKIYKGYTREMSGDDIGVWFSYDTEANEQIEVKMGVSFVSIENARLNMNTEQPGFDFDKVRSEASAMWNADLSKVIVEGGSYNDKVIFYTAMYHLLIHPNIIQDVNGEYPMMESLKVGKTSGNRYTVFSLWDTYRNVSTLMTLLYPEKQLDIIRTMIDMYKESGWLPKWELFGRETLTMEGDPSIPYIVDAYMRGLRDYDVETAYEAMKKGANTPGEFNLLRPDNDDYMTKGYVPLKEQYDNSVSHALEYYIADYNLSLLADALGKKEDAKLFRERAMGYKHYYSKEYGTLRPIMPDGTFYSPFDPKQGENFEPSPGFHEGNAWNYTFYVPHDIKGLARLMGGDNKFVDKLQSVFDNGYYDMANEPDIAYPYLFSYFKGQAWRTQKTVSELLSKYYHNAPNGLPGNDDTGTMSTWAIFSMMGFYPACPGDLDYVITSPTFDKITISLDKKFYPKGELVIEAPRSNESDIYIKDVYAGEKKLGKYTISQKDLVDAGTLKYQLTNTPKK